MHSKNNLLAEAPFLVAFLYAIGNQLPFIPYFNIVLASIGILTIFLSFITQKMSLGKWVLLLSCSLGTVISLTFTEGDLMNTNEVAYYIIFGLYVLYFLNNVDKLPAYVEKYKKYLLFICYTWHALVLISLPFPSSWNDRGFGSFSGSTFRLAPTAMLIMSVALLLVVCYNKKYVWLAFLPAISIMLGSSRTYMAVGIVFVAVVLYFAVRNKLTYMGVLAIVGTVAVVIIMNSAMGDKILSGFEQSDYHDALSQFTSSRSDFWRDNIEAFKEQPFINKLLGCGFNFVRQQTITDTNPQGLWAHNDFIQVLLTHGYVGLITYLCFIIALFKRIFTRKIPFVVKFAALFIWFFNAMFNMVYTYMAAVMSLYLMVMAIELYYQKRQEKAQAA